MKSVNLVAFCEPRVFAVVYKEVPPTNRIPLRTGRADSRFKSSKVWGSIVLYDNIYTPPDTCG